MGEARAAVLHGTEDLRIEYFPIPKTKEDDAVLRVEACGLCGTDHELFTGQIAAPCPVIPGHETVGTIESIGEVAALKWGVGVGDRVAVECWQACGRCAQCLKGIYRRCDQHGQTDLYGMINIERQPALYGGYATHHYLSPDSLVLPVPDQLTSVEATLFNPLGAGIKWGVEIPDTQPGDYVAILGPGIRGLCALVAARDAGAEFIAVTGYGSNDYPRLELAKALGADLVVDVAESDPVKSYRSATGGRLADVVVDVTANAPGALGQAVALSSVDATIVMAGVRGQKGAPGLNADAIIWKELTLKGALGGDAPVYRKALSLLAEKKFPFDLLTRQEVDLEETSELLTSMAGKSDVAPPVHGVIVPGS